MLLEIYKKKLKMRQKQPKNHKKVFKSSLKLLKFLTLQNLKKTINKSQLKNYLLMVAKRNLRRLTLPIWIRKSVL